MESLHPFLGPHLTSRSLTGCWIPNLSYASDLLDTLHLQLKHVMSTICDFCIIEMLSTLRAGIFSIVSCVSSQELVHDDRLVNNSREKWMGRTAPREALIKNIYSLQQKGSAAWAQLDFIAVSELLWPVTVTFLLPLYKWECLLYPFPVSPVK